MTPTSEMRAAAERALSSTRPCDCDRCYCDKPEDAAQAAAWDEEQAHAKSVLALCAELDAEKEACRRSDEIWRDNLQAHAAAHRMVREAIETIFGPAANLESEEATLLRGPEPQHEAEAVIAALLRVQTANEALRARVAELGASLAGLQLSGLSELNERVRLQNKCSDLAEEKAAAEASRDALAGMMARCRTVLGNMAAENEGAIFNRWPINHEPLRADARNLLPVIDALLTPAEKV